MPHVVNITRGLEPHFLRNVLDVLIIGAGPAGLSAALALGRARRSAAIFSFDNYLDFSSSALQTDSHKSIVSVQTDMMAELKTKYKTVLFTNTAATSVSEKGIVFEVEDVTGRCWKGRKIILATGCFERFPEISGYQGLWGTRILDPLRHRDPGTPDSSCAGVLITSDDPESIDASILSAHLARQHTPDITVLINGLSHLEKHPQVIAAAKKGFRIDSRTIRSFEKPEPESCVAVGYADGTKAVYDIVIHKPKVIINGPFVRQLDLETTPENRILVEGDYQETSVRGVFAAGSCASSVDHEAVEIVGGMKAGIGANLEIAEDDAGL